MPENADRGRPPRESPGSPESAGPPSATGGAATPTSPSPSAAPRPAPPSPSPRSSTGCATQGKLAEVPLRERVWQQLAGHPAGPGHRPGPGRLRPPARQRPAHGLAGAERRLRRAAAELLPAALDQVLAARFGPVARTGRGHAPTAARTARRPLPLLRGAADLAAELGARQGLRVPARPPPRRQPPPVHAHPARPRRPDGRPRRHPPRPSSTRPAAPAPCCAPWRRAGHEGHRGASPVRPGRRPRTRRPHRAAPRPRTPRPP